MGAHNRAFLARFLKAPLTWFLGLALAGVALSHGYRAFRTAWPVFQPDSIMCSTAGSKNGSSAIVAAMPNNMKTENPTDMILIWGVTRDISAIASCAAN